MPRRAASDSEARTRERCVCLAVSAAAEGVRIDRRCQHGVASVGLHVHGDAQLSMDKEIRRAPVRVGAQRTVVKEEADGGMVGEGKLTCRRRRRLWPSGRPVLPQRPKPSC